MSHLPIEQTDLYIRVVTVADQVWDMVQEWSRFAQDTVDRQLVRAVDSVGANLVEGDGRYTNTNPLHFFAIARASMREAIYWIERASKRGLVSTEPTNDLNERLDHSNRALNNLIGYRRSKQQGDRVRELTTPYNATDGLPEGPNTEHRTPQA